MLNIDFDYFFLNIILLYGFIYFGKKISKRENYWYNAIPCIILFTIIQGSRFLRGNDYLHYTHIFNGDIPDTTGFIFVTINNMCKNIGFNEYSIFIFYSFIFISCSMFFLKQYIQYAKWLFPLFLIAFLQFEEYMIRQAFSFSFFFLYIANLFKINPERINEVIKKNKKEIAYCLVWAIICVNIHSANIINILIISILYFFLKKPLHYNITICIYILCVYILPKIFDFSYLQPILNIFANSNELASAYVENSDKWFSSEGYNDIYTRNPLVQVLEVLGVSSLLYLGYKALTTNNNISRRFSTMYNLFFIGISIQSLFRNLEILNRIGYIMSLFWCLILSFVLCNKALIWSKIDKFLFIMLFWFIYEYLKYLLFPGNKTLFIWDAPFNISFFQ